MTKVLIAVDDSETSVRAARTAHALFGDEADYTVVSVAPSLPMLWGDDAMQWGMTYPLVVAPVGYTGSMPFVVRSPRGAGATVPASACEYAEQTAHDVAEKAALTGAHTLGNEGDPARAIIDAAHKLGADVIVVGSHDRRWFSKLFTKSVTTTVVRDADIPVLVSH